MKVTEELTLEELRKKQSKLQKKVTKLTSQLSKQQARAAQIDVYRNIITTYYQAVKHTRIQKVLGLFGWKTELDKWVELVSKSGLFNRDWYLGQHPDIDRSGMDPLVHYLLYGAYEGRDPNPFFDSRWYLQENRDVALSGANPLVHFLLEGAGEGRAAGPKFDTKAYLKLNRDVARSELNPLTHYLRHGVREKRRLRKRIVVRPKNPGWRVFLDLSAAQAGRGAASLKDVKGDIIDVVIPAYRGYSDTMACIYSVLRADCQTPYELIVIDDNSPEPKLSEALKRLAKRHLITLLKNKRNRGFVVSVNRGMKLHKDRDVILLNSDTEVYDDWIDRLVMQARKKGVGSVTPLSNNATICSYPEINENNAQPLEIPYWELDKMCQTINEGLDVELPTAVGFCMFIKRKSLSEIGYFDEKTFGRGYGEENDFCTRLLANGWRNILALDVFVRHSGEISFDQSAAKAQENGLKKLVAKHPDYLDRVNTHIEKNPAAKARRRLDSARLAAFIGGSKTVLAITHTLGGGIERHLKDEAVRLAGDDTGLAILTPAKNYSTRGALGAISYLHLPNIASLDLGQEREKLLDVLRDLKVSEIQIHSLAEWSLKTLELIPKLADQLGIPYSFICHDYIAICPQVNLIDSSGIYCNERGMAACIKCLWRKKRPAQDIHGKLSLLGAPNIYQWRQHYHTLLRGARGVYAPSIDTGKRIKGYYGDLDVSILPHREIMPRFESSLALPHKDGGKIHVLIIGAIGPHKGSSVIMDCARDAIQRELPLRFTIIGYTNMDKKLLQFSNIRITGAYNDKNIYTIIKKQNGHVVFLPSVWPETYCYTLSIALAARFPIVVFDTGAMAERLRIAKTGKILPLSMVKTPSKINDRILKHVQDPKPAL